MSGERRMKEKTVSPITASTLAELKEENPKLMFLGSGPPG